MLVGCFDVVVVSLCLVFYGWWLWFGIGLHVSGFGLVMCVAYGSLAWFGKLLFAAFDCVVLTLLFILLCFGVWLLL